MEFIDPGTQGASGIPEFVMAQPMSFAQALTEARQIIVQQSNRIKADLDRIKTMQENLTAATANTAELERQAREKTTEAANATEQLKQVTTTLEETRHAREQSDATADRQNQRIVQMQESISSLEKQLAEQTQRADNASHELDGIRGQVPTSEDTEALAALTSLLSAKKGGGGAAPAPAMAA